MNGKRLRDRGPSAWQATRRRAGKLAAQLIDLLLPTQCALCSAACHGSEGLLCPACVSQFFAGATPRCPCCANPLPASPMASGPAAAAPCCGQCLAQRPAFDATLVTADYALPVDQLVLQLKFAQRLALAALMAQRIAARLRQAQAAGTALPDLLCPVPLGPRRLASRGYNQALEIARPLARSLDLPLETRLLARVRETAAQSSVTPAQRRANIAGAFAVTSGVRGRHVGVVDDVMTSGATLDEIATVLKRHGAARVSNLVFARTPPPDH